VPELRPYQAAGVEWLRSSFSDPHARVRLLCDEMGLGKTPQAVMALPGQLWGEVDPGVLVVAPVGVQAVWRRHVQEWRPDLRATIVGATADLRAPTLGEVLIVSPDALGWATGAADRKKRGRVALGAHDAAAAAVGRLRAGVLALGPRTVILVDEAHRIKGATAQRARAVGAVCKTASARGATVWGITATPTPRDAADLWCLVDHLGASAHPAAWRGQGIVGWAKWSRGVCAKGVWKFWGEPLSPISEALGGLFMRRLVADHLEEIPPPTHAIHLVHLADELRAEADAVLGDACRSLGVDPRRVARDASDVGDEADEALAKATEHLDRGKMAALSAKISAAKASTVLDIMRQHVDAGHAVIVYSEHRAPIDAVAQLGYPVIVGGMTAAATKAAVSKFQEGEAMAIGFTAAGREGVTLTRASVFIEADTGWSADDRNQALGRAVRFGQEKSVTVIHVVAAHPLEALKMRVLRRKRRFNLTALGSSM
jgi:SNF2 family DNA or RNA helicase